MQKSEKDSKKTLTGIMKEAFVKNINLTNYAKANVILMLYSKQNEGLNVSYS